jgi:hypothetical protein
MEDTINEIFAIKQLDGCVVEFYPHIEQTSQNCGTIRDEILENIKIDNLQFSDDEYTEYIHGWKIMSVFRNFVHEYKYIQQKYIKLNNGLFIVSKIDYIDPNKFPILSKYYDISHKKVRTYHDKYLSISFITENEEHTYLKISFEINSKCQTGILRHLTSIISLIQ